MTHPTPTANGNRDPYPPAPDERKHCEHCEHCGLELPFDRIAQKWCEHPTAICLDRQRVDLLRHIRDELRRINVNLDAMVVAAKVANDKSDELRGFYGKIVDERRRARNAVVKRVFGKPRAGAARLPKKKKAKRRR